LKFSKTARARSFLIVGLHPANPMKGVKSALKSPFHPNLLYRVVSDVFIHKHQLADERYKHSAFSERLRNQSIRFSENDFGSAEIESF
jgi:hypothetical protein